MPDRKAPDAAHASEPHSDLFKHLCEIEGLFGELQGVIDALYILDDHLPPKLIITAAIHALHSVLWDKREAIQRQITAIFEAHFAERRRAGGIR